MSAFTSALHDISGNVFRKPRQDQKDVIHGFAMGVKLQFNKRKSAL